MHGGIAVLNAKSRVPRDFPKNDLTKSFENLNFNISILMSTNGNNLTRWQRKYLIGAAIVVPISPFLFLQGQFARWKVGVLPDAAGPNSGLVGDGGDPAKLFVIGESTVAGLGARTHEFALAGQFAKNLSQRIGRSVYWHVIGKNGVTARQTIEELVPRMPDEKFDYILVGLGGNDVLKLSSPVKWREDMTELLGILRSKHPEAVIFMSNCPMVKLSPAIPQPIRAILWELSKLHDANTREFTAEMKNVLYYPQPIDVDLQGFFADGIHPSERGYADWAAAMMRYFSENHEW
jgi:lysophospholipase L1-like esterase